MTHNVANTYQEEKPLASFRHSTLNRQQRNLSTTTGPDFEVDQFQQQIECGLAVQVVAANEIPIASGCIEPRLRSLCVGRFLSLRCSDFR